MLTPTRREVAVTPVAKVPAGAQLWGGPYDGATVRRGIRPGWGVILLLQDGRELHFGHFATVAWLHPASRRPS